MNGSEFIGGLVSVLSVSMSAAHASQAPIQAQFFTISPSHPDDLWMQIELSARESIESSLTDPTVNWLPRREISLAKLSDHPPRFPAAADFAAALRAASENGLVFLYTDLRTYEQVLGFANLRAALLAPGLEVVAPRLVGIPLSIIERRSNPVSALEKPRIAYATTEDYPVEELEVRALLKAAAGIEAADIERVQNARVLAERLYGQELRGGNEVPRNRRVDLVVIAEQEPLVFVDEFLAAFEELYGGQGGLDFVGPPTNSANQQRLVAGGDVLSHVWLRGEPHLDRNVLDRLPAYELLFTPRRRRAEADSFGYAIILSNLSAIDDPRIFEGFARASRKLSNLNFFLPFDILDAVPGNLRSRVYTSFLLASHQDDPSDELKTLSLLFHHQLVRAEYSSEYKQGLNSLFGLLGTGHTNIAELELETARINALRKELSNDSYLDAEEDGLHGAFLPWLLELARIPLDFSSTDIVEAKRVRGVSLKRLLYSCDSSVLLYGQALEELDKGIQAKELKDRRTHFADAALKFLAAMQEGPEPRPLTKGCSMRGSQFYNPYYQFTRLVFLMESDASRDSPR